MNEASNNNKLIIEAIRKISLGSTYDRASMAPTGTGGVGTARLIHGYVAKVHDNPADEEYKEYAGTIDVGEFPDETACPEPIIHKGVMLSGLKDNSNGFLIVPTLFSDVTIVSDAATKYMYVVNYSHANVVQLDSHKETSIGVTETEELDPNDNDSPDYDQLVKTGKQSKTKYSSESIVQTVTSEKDGKESKTVSTSTSITQSVKDSEQKITDTEVVSKVGDTSVSISNGSVKLGGEDADEPIVLGNQLASLMEDFITAVEQIKVPTMMGTMPIINIAQVASLKTKIALFKSQTSYTK